MTDLKDPPRLVDPSGAAPVGLRQLLDAARNDVGSAAQVARLAERLGPLVGSPALPAPPVVAAASGMGAGAAVKLGLAGVALAIAGGGAWLLSLPRVAPPLASISPPPAPTVTSPTPAVAPPPGPAALSPNATSTAPGLDSATPNAAKVEQPGGAKPPAKLRPPLEQSEADLLEQARSALRSDPARALARANEHRSRFSGGVLVQEREVIAIQALRQLGRTAEAHSRAEAFQRAFPGSAFQRKLKSSP